MPLAAVTAAIVEQSAEAATATQAFEGAIVNVQFVWPKAEAAAKKRIPIAVVTKRRNLFFTIPPTPSEMCELARINPLGLGEGRTI